jgi:signal transduction histidine kinase
VPRTAVGRPRTEKAVVPPTWLGDSDMAEHIAGFDWGRTPLGPLGAWPAALRSAVSICLRSRFQMAIYWGPDLTCIYNDAERDALGELHPGALGLPARRLLQPSWHVVGPQLDAVLRTGVATWSEDQELVLSRRGSPEPGYFTYSYSPLIDGDSGGAVAGVLLVTQDTTARVLAERRAETLRAEEHASSEHALRGLLEELRAAQRRVAAARDAERRRIERNLHDGAQQRLVAIQFALSDVAERMQAEPDRARDELELVRSDLSDALEELRELAHGLYPPLLATDGLVPALEAIARQAPVPTRVTAAPIDDLPSEVEAAVYFCCVEALQNVGKHAGENARAHIRIDGGGDVMRFSVEDDGAGFDVGHVREGAGLVNLRDRLVQFGGMADIASAPGRGTRVSGTIPLR